jgi:hypothetical protein
VENDCLITEEFKEKMIIGEERDASLVGFSKLVYFNVEHYKVGDDQVNFIHNGSNSSICSQLKLYCYYAIIVYSSST